ncbi:hypothetical protein Rhopal_004183-T1 [Rhodotorula paludigena]|uniref:Uncharacterized protein n=1 Tax=Rhodotorula paludigena TaxID=86838 RepID=A0AAV5GMP4_9BASI|nr:hypothetical protein Rhopal_004183-T1 [Rhodotorula paludigena]
MSTTSHSTTGEGKTTTQQVGDKMQSGLDTAKAKVHETVVSAEGKKDEDSTASGATPGTTEGLGGTKSTSQGYNIEGQNAPGQSGREDKTTGEAFKDSAKDTLTGDSTTGNKHEGVQPSGLTTGATDTSGTTTGTTAKGTVDPASVGSA